MQTNTYRRHSLRLSETTKRVIGVIAIAVSLSACTTVSHTPLSQDVSAHLAGKRVVLTKYSTPNFAALTPGTAAFGVLGALVMIAQSDEIVKTNCLEDPSLKISQELAEKLSVERGITLVPNQNII